MAGNPFGSAEQLRVKLRQARLYLCTDARAGRGDLVEFLDAVLSNGVDVVQLRQKGLEARDELRYLELFAEAAYRHGKLFAVNDRADIARLAGADGVHLGQTDLRPSEARRLLPEGAIVGYSTHSLAQAQDALQEPIDYLAVGPVFATLSKEKPDPVVGLELVRAVRQLTRLPLVAIGGIVPENAGAVVAAGVDGLAVIGGLAGPGGLEAALLGYRRALVGLC